jgi:hypothetical protein
MVQVCPSGPRLQPSIHPLPPSLSVCPPWRGACPAGMTTRRRCWRKMIWWTDASWDPMVARWLRRWYDHTYQLKNMQVCLALLIRNMNISNQSLATTQRRWPGSKGSGNFMWRTNNVDVSSSLPNQKPPWLKKLAHNLHGLWVSTSWMKKFTLTSRI